MPVPQAAGPINVLFNGRSISFYGVDEVELTYNEVVANSLEAVAQVGLLYTVTYQKAAGPKTEGCLAPGERVRAKGGNRFSVAHRQCVKRATPPIARSIAMKLFAVCALMLSVLPADRCSRDLSEKSHRRQLPAP
jgi:hypothetical protein